MLSAPGDFVPLNPGQRALLGQKENGQRILQKFILISAKCRHLQWTLSLWIPYQGLCHWTPHGASSKTISQARSITLAPTFLSYIIPSRSFLYNHICTIEKNSHFKIFFIHCISCLGWAACPCFICLDAASFQKASTIYSFMPALDSLHRPSKSEFITVSCRPPNAFQPSTNN